MQVQFLPGALDECKGAEHKGIEQKRSLRGKGDFPLKSNFSVNATG